MRPSPRLVCCLVPVLGVAIAGVAGCSGTRTPPAKTIGQRIEDAKRNTSPGGPARELSKIARFQYRSGDESGALETLRQAQRTIKPDADAAVFAPRLVDIAVSFGLMDDAPAARKAAVDAEKMAGRIEDPVLRIDVLSRLGGLYGDKQEGLGEVRKAQTLLAKAEELAVGDAVSDRFRAPALAAVALGYANADLADKAEALVGRLEGLVESLDQRPKVDALAAAANVRAKRGRPGQGPARRRSEDGPGDRRRREPNVCAGDRGQRPELGRRQARGSDDRGRGRTGRREDRGSRAAEGCGAPGPQPAGGPQGPIRVAHANPYRFPVTFLSASRASERAAAWSTIGSG